MLLFGWPWLVPLTLIPGFAFMGVGAAEMALSTLFVPAATLNPLLSEGLFTIGILTFLFGVA
jgi:hypothetical protein